MVPITGSNALPKSHTQEGPVLSQLLNYQFSVKVQRVLYSESPKCVRDLATKSAHDSPILRILSKNSVAAVSSLSNPS